MANGVDGDGFDFAFDDTRPYDENACRIAAWRSDQSPMRPLSCDIQAGGGGVDEGLGRWMFHLRTPLADLGEQPSVSIFVQWVRVGLLQGSITVNASTIQTGLARSHR